jgi:hypothetical protein
MKAAQTQGECHGSQISILVSGEAVRLGVGPTLVLARLGGRRRLRQLILFLGGLVQVQPLDQSRAAYLARHLIDYRAALDLLAQGRARSMEMG